MTSVVGAIRLGTRASRLARVQTDLVRKALARLDPTVEFRSIEITTEYSQASPATGCLIVPSTRSGEKLGAALRFRCESNLRL